MVNENRQVLIHLHTGEVKAPGSEVVELGEIAVQHNDSEVALYTKKNNGEIAKFIDVTAVESKVNAEKTRAEGVESNLNSAINTEKARAEGAEDALSERINALTGSSHTHSNKTVLDGITAEKVTAWDGAEAAANAYTDSKVDGKFDEAGAAAAVKTWVEEQKYLTSHQDISNLATKGEVAEAVSGMATEAWVKEQNYLTEHQDISNLATKSEVAEAVSGMATEAYVDNKIDELSDIYAPKADVETLVGEDTGKSVRDIAVEEVANIVSGAPEAFDTLVEIADWISSDSAGTEVLIGRVAALESDVEVLSGASHTHSNKIVLDGITAEKVTAWDGAQAAAEAYADGLASNYDEAGAAAAVKTWVEEQKYLTSHQDISNLATKGEVATAQAAAEAYADGLASNYDEAGAAASAETNSKSYTDTKIQSLRIDCGTF